MKQPNNTMIYNTALYLRLSRDDELQGESGSIQTQRMMLRQYAEEHGLTVVGEYIDDGWSGTNFDRPGFQRMIDDIEEGKINCVVTKDLSRLGRNYILTGQYTEIYYADKICERCALWCIRSSGIYQRPRQVRASSGRPGNEVDH